MTRARDTDPDGEVDEPWNSFGGAGLGNHALSELREPPRLMHGDDACAREGVEVATGAVAM